MQLPVDGLGEERLVFDGELPTQLLLTGEESLPSKSAGKGTRAFLLARNCSWCLSRDFAGECVAGGARNDYTTTCCAHDILFVLHLCTRLVGLAQRKSRSHSRMAWSQHVLQVNLLPQISRRHSR